MNLKKLSDITISQHGIVKTIKSNRDIKRRLMDLGIIEGTLVECVLKSPSQDPYAYNIRGTLIALRKKITQDIIIEVI